MNLGGVVHLNKTGLFVIFGAALILFVYVVSNSGKSNGTSHKINLKDLLKVCIKAAKNGGLEVVANKDDLKVKSKGLTKEGMVDSVTNADFRSHCSIIGTLKHVYPTLNIISEEAKSVCDRNQHIDYSNIDSTISADLEDFWENEGDITVWIDPLDATHEYTEKLYEFVTTMVCVAVRGKPVIGVIHKPFSAKDKSPTSWAWVGKGKSDNLGNSNYQKNEQLNIIISRSHSGEIKKILAENLKNYNIVIAAGAGYKTLEVVEGNVDAYLHMTAIKKWDICAGNAIITAMGGKMTTKYNENIDYSDLATVRNDRGLVATMKNHEIFIGKF